MARDLKDFAYCCKWYITFKTLIKVRVWKMPFLKLEYFSHLGPQDRGRTMKMFTVFKIRLNHDLRTTSKARLHYTL